jgi:hypothetical protein
MPILSEFRGGVHSGVLIALAKSNTTRAKAGFLRVFGGSTRFLAMWQPRYGPRVNW